jgi:ABC-type Fe3+ transport system substrate-binding protein
MERRFIVFLSLLLFFCQGSIAAGAEESWETQWTKTLQAAREEGEVAIYGADDYGALFMAFQKKYPEIKVIHAAGRGNQIAQRLMAERRAGKYLADIYVGGSGTGYDLYMARVFEPLKPALIVPEVVDLSRWWAGRHFYHDDKSQYLLAFNGVVQSRFGYNTKLVHASEFKSHWDLLNPKWKAKIIAFDPAMGSAVTGGLQFIYRNPKLGPPFLRGLLGEMDLVVTRDSRQLVDWVAVGKFPLYALAGADRAGIYEAKRQGLPVDHFDAKSFKEGAGVSTSNGNVALIDRAPHPNSARVAINWLLLREGQSLLQKISRGENNSLRIDIPKDDVLPHLRLVEGAEYLLEVGPGYKNMDPVLQIVNEVWKK